MLKYIVSTENRIFNNIIVFPYIVIMKILHIASYFSGSKVHANLFKELAKQGIDQIIYCPVRNPGKIGGNSFVADGTEIIYDDVIEPYHHYMYHIKCAAIFRSMRYRVKLDGVDIVHAGSLFSDGGIAYKIYKRFGIPYIVAIRSTDVDDFLIKAPHTWLSGKRILLGASKIVFISPSLENRFRNHRFIKTFFSEIEKKIVIQPNGIDDYWIENVNREPLKNNHQILYVGTFLRRKNPLLLIRAVLELENHYQDIVLNLIGSTGEDEDAVLNYASKYKDRICYHGRINKKDELMAHYRSNSLFVLPSVNETFGLVYLEALSQNLPVIYTKGDGIDGLLSDSNGVGMPSPSLDNIKNAIAAIIDERDSYSNKNIDFNQFRWSAIAARYISFYKCIIKNSISS